MDEKFIFEKVINRLYGIKYPWFHNLEIKSLQPRFRSSVLFIIGKITVDENWLGDQWRKYYHSIPFPDITQDDVSFADFIGGDLAKNLKNDLILSYKSINPKSDIDDTTFTYVKVVTDDLQIYEEISGTKLMTRLIEKYDNLKNQNMNTRLRRRLGMLDYEIESKMRAVYRPDNICENYRSGEELLDVVGEAAIDSMYWNYFADIDDNSGEWVNIYYDMVKYIRDKYGNKIKEYYHINCGD